MNKVNVVLKERDFLNFHEKVISMGYEKLTMGYSSKLFKRLGIYPPRPIFGREVSYVYKSIDPANKYAVIVHTTYLEKEKKWRDTETDAGWVLIVEGDKALYFARPLLRTKGFILKMLRYAWITKWKVDNRPLCPHCGAFMHIERKTKTKEEKIFTRQYYWICRAKENHSSGRPEFLSWDNNLPPKSSKFVAIRRENTARYNAKNKKEGKKPTAAFTIRNPWIVGKKENLT